MEQQKMVSPGQDCLHAWFCQKWWRNLARGADMAFIKTNRANEFFLTELKAEEPSTYNVITDGKLHALKKRGFVDVSRGKAEV